MNPIHVYARELRPALPLAVFAPARSRLLWLPALLAIIAASTAGIASHRLPGAVVPVLSLVIGVAFGSLSFLGHEVLHGAIVRGRRARYVIGWIAFLPFVISPTLWVAWHNRVHHGNANRAGIDPDANPTLAEYRGSAVVRAITDHFAPGRRSATGFIGLMIGFSVQSAFVLSFALRKKYLSAREHRRALADTAVGVLVWALLAATIGVVPFVFSFVVPLLVANVIVMAFIFTNHGLSPLTEVNDPLLNSLSVTGPRWFEWLTLGFGFHVEHHLFPSMSSRHAPAVRRLLLAHWPERYRSMPLVRALVLLHRTARVYLEPRTLFDPLSGQSWPALQPAGHGPELDVRRAPPGRLAPLRP